MQSRTMDDDDDIPTYSLDEVEPKKPSRRQSQSRTGRPGERTEQKPGFILDEGESEPWGHLSRAEQLDDQTQKELCNYSRAIGLIGVLSLALALACVVAIFGIHDVLSEKELFDSQVGFGIFPLFIGLGVMLLVVTYSAWWRPYWGRTPGQIFCVFIGISMSLSLVKGAMPPIGYFLSFVFLAVGVWGFVAYARSARLFGEDRYTYKELGSAIKRRERSRRSA